MHRWILYSNLHVIPVAAGFVLGSYALAGVHADPAYVVLASCGAFLVYQWDRVSGLSPEDDVNVPERRRWLLRHRVYIAASSVAAAAGGLCAVWVSSRLVQYAALLLGIAGMIYAVPLLFGRRPKELPGIKNVLIALCWVAGGVAVPLIDAGAAPLVVGWLIVHRLLYILPNLAAAAFADRAGDEKAGIPVNILAVRLADPVQVGVVSLSAVAILAFIAVSAGWSPPGTRGGILAAVDAVGLAGAVLTLRSRGSAGYRDVVLLDLWVAFPMITWAVSVLI